MTIKRLSLAVCAGPSIWAEAGLPPRPAAIVAPGVGANDHLQFASAETSASTAPARDTASTATAQVVIIVGPGSHPPGTHEEAAGARVIQYCLEHAANVGGIRARVFYVWPKDEAVLDAADTVVFTGDTFPPARLPDSGRIMEKLTAMMDRGCGLVCVHYATGLRGDEVAADGEHPLLHWLGGYFLTDPATNRSIARIMDATISPGDQPHPVLRGWHEFKLNDEPYYNNFFGPRGMAANVTPLAVAMLPPESPKREIVAWCVQRKDGGRGVAVVMPHFFRNWQVADLRKLILHGVVWTAKLDVPMEGVETALPNPAMFHPRSSNPLPEKNPAPPTNAPAPVPGSYAAL